MRVRNEGAYHVSGIGRRESKVASTAMPGRGRRRAACPESSKRGNRSQIVESRDGDRGKKPRQRGWFAERGG